MTTYIKGKRLHLVAFLHYATILALCSRIKGIHCFSVSTTRPQQSAQIISADPVIVSLQNVFEESLNNDILSIIQRSELAKTKNYQEDVFSDSAHEREDALFLKIAKPFLNEIPAEYQSPVEMFVFVVTKFQHELKEEDIIIGANAIQRRQAVEKWKSEEGQSILELSDDGFESIGKRYEVPDDLMWLESKIPHILSDDWTLKDATIVCYESGDSQVPHLDPCDATILICLQECKVGGDTCFPLLDYRLENTSGNGLLFFSSNSISGNNESNALSMHHGGKVYEGKKIVVQLMLDWNGEATATASWLDVVQPSLFN